MKESQEIFLSKALTDYVKEKHTQEECSGFIDGFKAAYAKINEIDSMCKHETFTLPEKDNFGNTHYCKKCGLWNY